MRGELPSFKRCCFCLPLRRGLLFWGYFKLLVATMLLYPMGLSVMFFIHLMIFGPFGYLVNLVLFITLMLDLAFNIALVVAGHTKNHKIFRVYYYYTITFTVLSVALMAAFTIMYLGARTHRISFSQDFPRHPFFSILIWNLVFTFAYIILQLYIILLVRSEVLKLNNDGMFRFVNNEAEAECTLNIDPEADHEKLKELSTENDNQNNNDKV